MGAQGAQQKSSSRTPALWCWIAGRDLNGDWWTDATWWNDYTTVLHKTKHCTRWQGAAHWKRSAVRNGLPAAAGVTGWDWWFHPAVTILAMALIGAACAAHWGWHGFRAFWPPKHWWQWARPFRLTLKEELGVDPTHLEIARDRSWVVIGVPREYLGTDNHRGAFVRAAVD